jgi:NADP-dependent 3-hydroxy acid dehydrogenase YdfG
VLWRGLEGEDRVRYVQLDVTSGQSIAKVADQIGKNDVKIDVLVNNAGLGKGSELKKPCPDYEFAKMCLNINTLGAMNLTEGLLPHLSNTAKVVSIGSFYGGLRFHSK